MKPIIFNSKKKNKSMNCKNMIRSSMRRNIMMLKNVRGNNTMRRKTMRRNTMRRNTMRRNTMRRTKIRGGTVNPISEIGSMFGTLGSSIQSAVSSLYVPLTTAYNPSLPISASPSSQFITNQLPQSIPTIFKSL